MKNNPIEINKEYTIKELIGSNFYGDSKIKFNKKTQDSYTKDILSFTISAETDEDFVNVDELITITMNNISTILRTATLATCIQEFTHQKTYKESLSNHNHKKYSYSNTIKKFIEELRKNKTDIKPHYPKNNIPSKLIPISNDKGIGGKILRSDIVKGADYKLFGNFITVFANNNSFNKREGDNHGSYSMMISSRYDIKKYIDTIEENEIKTHRQHTIELMREIFRELKDIISQKENVNYKIITLEDGSSYPNNSHLHITVAEQSLHPEKIFKKNRSLGFKTENKEDIINQTKFYIQETFGSQLFFDAVYSVLKKYSDVIENIIAKDTELLHKYTLTKV